MRDRLDGNRPVLNNQFSFPSMEEGFLIGLLIYNRPERTSIPKSDKFSCIVTWLLLKVEIGV